LVVAGIAGAVIFGTTGKALGYFVERDKKKTVLEDKKLQANLENAKSDIERIKIAENAQIHNNNLIEALGRSIQNIHNDIQNLDDIYKGKKNMPKDESRDTIKFKYQNKIAELEQVNQQLRNAQAASATLTQVISNPAQYSAQAQLIKNLKKGSLATLTLAIAILLFIIIWRILGEWIIQLCRNSWLFITGKKSVEENKKSSDESK